MIILLVASILFSCGQESKSLKEEIKMLKEENAFLKAENVGLKKEIEELYKKLEGHVPIKSIPEDKKLGK
jgi:regulator of replication initiation timing